MKTLKMWVIKDPSGKFIESSMAIKKKSCINWFVGCYTWRSWLKNGWTCVKVSVTIKEV